MAEEKECAAGIHEAAGLCKYCFKRLYWAMQADGKYHPKNRDGSSHDCRRKAARREAWLKAHGPMLREKAVLDWQFRKTVGGQE